MAQNTEQFVRLFAQHDRELYRYVLTLLGDASAAEDVMQEVAADLWKKFDDYDPDQPFRAWARSFAKVQVMRHRRTMSRDRLLFNDELLDKLAAEREASEPTLELRRRALRTCMSKLSEEDRRLLTIRYTETTTVTDAANVAGVERKKMYTSLDRIRRVLMRCIDLALVSEGDG